MVPQKVNLPEILPARHPGYVDWFESVAYLGLLFIAAFLCWQEVRGRTLIPGEEPVHKLK